MNRIDFWISCLLTCAVAFFASQGVVQAQPAKHYRAIRDQGTQPMSWVERLGPDAFPRLRDDYKDARYKRDVVRAIAASRHKDSRAFLIGLLKDPQTLEPRNRDQARQEAINGLLRYGADKKVALAIAELLKDKSRNVRESALDALYLLAHPATVDALIAHDKKSRRNSKACNTLVRILDKKSKAYLTEKLSKLKKTYMPWFGDIALEVGRQGRKELTPLLMAAAEHSRKGRTVRPDVFRGLGLLGDKRAVPVLRRVLLERDFSTRYWCAIALGQLGDRSALPDLKTAFDKVKDLPASRPWVNKSAIAYARASLGDKAGKKYLLQLLKHEEPKARMYGLLGLMRLEGDLWASKIVAVFSLYADIDGCPRYPRDQIFSVMVNIGTEESIERLVEVSQFKKAGGAPHSARRAIQRLGWRKRTQVAAARIKYGSWEERSKAAREVDSLVADPFPQYAKLLTDGDMEARVLAVRRLGMFARKRYGRQLNKATKDPAWQVALEAERMLKRKAGHDGFPEFMPQPPLLGQSDLGGYLLDALPRQAPVYAGIQHPLTSAPIRRISEDAKGLLWAATRAGVQRYDGMQWRIFGEEQGLCSAEVYDLAISGDRIFVATAKGLAMGSLKKIRKGLGKRKAFRCIPHDRQTFRIAVRGKKVFVGSEKGVLSLVKGRLKPMGGPKGNVGAMVLDKKGALWVAQVPPRNQPRGLQIDPPLFKHYKGKWTPLRKPFQHYYGQPNTQIGFKREAVSVRDLAVDRKGRLLIATSFGIFRMDGNRISALSRGKGYYPWHAARGVATAKDGRVLAAYQGYVDVLEKGRWKRLAVEPLDRRSFRGGGTPVVCLTGASSGGIYFGLNYNRVIPGTHKMVNLVRWAKKDKKRVALPPDTLIARVHGGSLVVENEATDMAPPNKARKFNKGKPLRIPANIVTFSAVAKDPWDYSAVEFRFKVDEAPWTDWSQNNGLISPQMLDEGVHRVLAQSRDEEGNVDPSPAEVRFAVHTKDMTVIRIQDGQFRRIFPSQYVRYQKVGLGKVQLHNTRDKPVEVNLELKIEDMFERAAATRVTLAAGEKKWVDVMAPFSDKVLSNEGQRTVQAVVEARYSFDDVDRSARRSFPVELLEANAFVWDEPDRLASFINGRDPYVQKISSELYRSFAQKHPHEAKGSHPLRNHLLALYAYQALSELGMKYKPDSGRPFASLRAGAMDTVQFPSQTLSRKTGDCDDLTVLYASLLENLNVSTAVLPVAGHVFLMYDTGVRAENRGAFPVDIRKTVDRDGRLWVPVETTMLGKSSTFSQAWSKGAENYHGKYRAKSVKPVDVRVAWAEYPPATRPADLKQVSVPRLAGAMNEAGQLLAQYGKKVETLAPAGGEGHDALVAKGAVLARSGLFDKATKAYEQALKANDSFTARYGLGAAQAGQGEMLMALVEFQKALGKASDGKQKFKAQLAIAQCYKVNGNLKKARKHLDKAVALNPAARFDSRYRSLVKYLGQEQETKAAGEDESPPYFQEILSGL